MRRDDGGWTNHASNGALAPDCLAGAALPASFGGGYARDDACGDGGGQLPEPLQHPDALSIEVDAVSRRLHSGVARGQPSQVARALSELLAMAQTQASAAPEALAMAVVGCVCPGQQRDSYNVGLLPRMQELGSEGALEYADDDGRLVSFAPPAEVRRLAMEIAQVFFDAAQRAQEEAQRQATLNALKAAGIHIPGME